MTATIIRTTLTDGSYAYGVTIDDGHGLVIEIDCHDERAAMRLQDVLLDTTNVEDGGYPGYL